MMVFKNYFQQERISHVDNIVVTATTIDVINSGGATTLEGNYALVLVMFYFCHLIFFFFFFIQFHYGKFKLKTGAQRGPNCMWENWAWSRIHAFVVSIRACPNPARTQCFANPNIYKRNRWFDLWCTDHRWLHLCQLTPATHFLPWHLLVDAQANFSELSLVSDCFSLYLRAKIKISWNL